MDTYSDSFKRHTPTVEKLKNWLALGSSSSMKETVARAYSPSSIMDLNYFSLEDIVDNWNLIDTDRSILIHAAMNMEVEGYSSSGNWVGCKHYCAFGMKSVHEYVGHLFSLIMCGGDWSSRGNLLHDNLYYSSELRSGRFIKNRILSPAYSNANGKEWYRDHKDSLCSLTKKYTCHTFVVHEEDVSIFDSEYIEKAREGWETTRDRLTHLLRLKNVKALSWHREISYTSIESGLLHPHTHVMIWTDGGYSQEKIGESLKLDKEIAYSSHKWSKGSTSRLEGYYRYLNGVYSIEKAYKREWTPENSNKINLNFREMTWATLAIFDGIRKVGSGNISTNIPCLQKSRKKNKIKETKSTPEEKQPDEQRLSKGNTLSPRGEWNLQGGESRDTRRTREESLWADSISEKCRVNRTSVFSGRGELRVEKGFQECDVGEWSG